MAAPAYHLQVGALVAGKYRVGETLGAGGMSAVYAAVHVGLEQRVALKVLHPQHAADPKLVQRFMREAKASARITGEHVGRVIDVGATEDGSPFIALELLHGEDLGDSSIEADRCPSGRRSTSFSRPATGSRGPTRWASSTGTSSPRTSS